MKNKKFFVIFLLIFLVALSLIVILKNNKGMKSKEIGSLTMSYYRNSNLILDNSKGEFSKEYYFEIKSNKDTLYYITLNSNNENNNISNSSIMISLKKNEEYIIGTKNSGIPLSSFEKDDSLEINKFAILLNQNIEANSKDKFILKVWIENTDTSDLFYELNLEVKEGKKEEYPYIYLESESGSLNIKKISLKDIDSYLELPSPVKEGYKFLGWYTEKTGGKAKSLSDLKNISKDITLYAQYEKIEEVKLQNPILENNKKNQYTVSFNTNGGSKISSFKLYEGEKIELPKPPTKKGYKFLGWKEKISYMPNSNLVFNALWEPNKYRLILNLSDISSITKEIIYDMKYGDMITPTKEGYKFLGWYTEKTGGTKVKSTDIVKVTEDTRLYAQYEANKYLLTLQASETSSTTKEITYDKEYGTLPTATKEGYKFLGWYTEKTGGTKIESTDIVKVIEDTTLYAQYEAKNYNLIFDPTTGTTDISNKEVTYDKEYGTLPTATKEGYKFLGWYTEKIGGTKVKSTDLVKVTEDTTLYAQYEANKYTITFDATIGTTDVNSKEVIYDSEYGELPEATKEGYPFKGWYTEKTGGTKVESTDIVKITRDTTLYAQYVLIPITSIDINFSEYTLLMFFGNYQIVATVLPKNAENQNLKYEIINNTYSGLTINENTGLITYVDNGNNGSCNSFTVKVSAQDGSGVYITRKLLMEKPNNGCWTPRY